MSVGKAALPITADADWQPPAADAGGGPAPGKLTRTAAMATLEDRAPSVLHGARCDGDSVPIPTEDCFLDPVQRGRLVQDTIELVDRAQQAYLHAVGKVYVDAKTAPEPVSLALIMLSALMPIGERAIDAGLDLARLGKIEGVVERAEQRAALARELAGASAGSVARTVLERGKRHAEAVLSGEASAKTTEIGYVKLLERAAPRAFRVTREWVKAGATDAELVAALLAWDEDNHTIEGYEDQIADQLKRYAASGLARLGRNRESAIEIDGAPIAGGSVVTRERRLVYVVSIATRQRRLKIERSEGPAANLSGFVDPRALIPERLGGPRQPALSTADEPLEYPIEITPGTTTYVDVAPEDTALALERQRATWGTEPAEVLTPWG